LVVRARWSLQQSVACTSEVSAFTAALLQQFYYGIRNFRFSLLFTKILLDILNTLPPHRRSESLRTICDFTCLYLHIPSSPSCPVHVHVTEEHLQAANLLLVSTDPASLIRPLPTVHGASCAVIRLMAEPVGQLLFLESLRAPVTEEIFSMVHRDIDLCLRITGLWQPFGVLNDLMSAIFETVLAWGIFRLLSGGRQDFRGFHLPDLRPTYEVNRPAEIKNQDQLLKEQADIYREEGQLLDHVLPQLSQDLASRFRTPGESFAAVENMTHLASSATSTSSPDPPCSTSAAPPPASSSYSSSSSSSSASFTSSAPTPTRPSSASTSAASTPAPVLQMRPTPSDLLKLSNRQLHDKAIELCRSVTTRLQRSGNWGRYLPPTLNIPFFNLASEMAEWDLWPELRTLDTFLKEPERVWPSVVNPRASITSAIELQQKNVEPGQERHKFTIKRLSSLVYLEGLTPEAMTQRLEAEAEGRSQKQQQAPTPPPDFGIDFASLWNTTGPDNLQDILGRLDADPFSPSTTPGYLDDPYPFM